MISDLTLDTLRAGLHGLNERKLAAEDAVANMETPGYIAKKVDFEDQLARAVDSGHPDSARVSMSMSTAEALPNGNNVKVDQEMIGLTDTGLRQQLLIEAVNAKFRLMRAVIGAS
jgi:flagellar basal-body rod protein FlgB